MGIRRGYNFSAKRSDASWLGRSFRGVVHSEKGGCEEARQLIFLRLKSHERLLARRLAKKPDIGSFYKGHAETNPDKAEDLFRAAVERAPGDSGILGSYANFLVNIRKDYERAQVHNPGTSSPESRC